MDNRQRRRPDRISDISSKYSAEKKLEDKSFLTVRYLIRPVSFLISFMLARKGISPNSVTWFSGIIGVLGASCLLFSSMQLAGCFLLLSWLVCDHVDGDLARYYGESSIYGDYLDTIMCYLVLALFPFILGISVFTSQSDQSLGLVCALFGGIGTVGSILPRLAYQKMVSYPEIQYDLREGFSFNPRNSIIKKGANSIKVVIYNIINPSGLLFFILTLSVFLGVVPIFVVVYGSIMAIVTIVTLYKFIYSLYRQK